MKRKCEPLRTDSEGLALAAQVVGGSGQYGYSWASMDATLIWGAPVDLGNDPGVTLDLGVYTVFLRVTDLGPRSEEHTSELQSQ